MKIGVCQVCMSDTVLITGVTGYLGSNLASVLLACGYRVIALKRKLSSLHRVEAFSSSIVMYDIEGLDFDIPFKAHGKIDIIIHTATCYGRKNESVYEVFAANTDFPLRLLDAGSRAGVELFINTDTSLDKFLNLYSFSKNQLLRWGRYFSMHGKIQFLNIKLEHFYGPNDDPIKFTTFIIDSCLDNTQELKLTKGEQRRDFVYIKDVLSAYLVLLEKRESFKSDFMEFDVGSGGSISIREFVESIHHLTASKTHLVFGAIPYREGEVMGSKANIEPLLKLGWRCEHTLMEGLKLTIHRSKR